MAKGKKTGGGSRAGIPNKATTEFREIVQKIIEDNSQNIGLWLTRVAVEDPDKALDLIAKLAEYVAPKLARHEHRAADGQAMLSGVISFVNAPGSDGGR